MIWRQKNVTQRINTKKAQRNEDAGSSWWTGRQAAGFGRVPPARKLHKAPANNSYWWESRLAKINTNVQCISVCCYSIWPGSHYRTFSWILLWPTKVHLLLHINSSQTWNVCRYSTATNNISSRLCTVCTGLKITITNQYRTWWWWKRVTTNKWGTVSL